jgi:hypothetical protein
MKIGRLRTLQLERKFGLRTRCQTLFVAGEEIYNGRDILIYFGGLDRCRIWSNKNWCRFVDKYSCLGLDLQRFQRWSTSVSCSRRGQGAASFVKHVVDPGSFSKKNTSRHSSGWNRSENILGFHYTKEIRNCGKLLPGRNNLHSRAHC